MGAAMVRLMEGVLPDAGPDSAWQAKARGPTLRRLFGAYLNEDLWSTLRRLKQIDDNQCEYLSFEESQQLLKIPDFHLMFLWDLFSRQNSLVLVRELLTTICVFSSAELEDKGRFLLSVFDTSRTGQSTGAEVATLCSTVLGVLARCTCAKVVKPGAVSSALREELPSLLPQYREVLKRKGIGHTSAEQFFESERLITMDMLGFLLPDLQATYAASPLAGGAPGGALPAPPCEWGAPAAAAADGAGEGSGAAAAATSPGGAAAAAAARSPAGAGASAARALAAARSPTGALSGRHLTEAQVMDAVNEEERLAEEEAERLEAARQAELAALAEEAARAKAALPPADGRLIVHGYGLADIEKDVAKFRYLLSKGLSHALGLPSGCVEILRLSQGSIRVDFRLHPSGRAGDTRDGAALLRELGEQFGSCDSPLRRGPFREYAASSELRAKGYDPGAAAAQPRRPTMFSAGAQATDAALTVEEIEQLVEEERCRCEAAEAALAAVRSQLAARGAAIADLERRAAADRAAAAAAADAAMAAEAAEAAAKARRAKEIEQTAAAEAAAAAKAAEAAEAAMSAAPVERAAAVKTDAAREATAAPEAAATIAAVAGREVAETAAASDVAEFAKATPPPQALPFVRPDIRLLPFGGGPLLTFL